MVSLPDDVLERVDAEARRRSTSRSALLTLAVRRELDRRDPRRRASGHRAFAGTIPWCRGVRVGGSGARRPQRSGAHQHGLTFYDALFAVAAQALDAPLISMDRQLLAADLAETPATFGSAIVITA